MIWRILVALFVAWLLSQFGFAAFMIAGLAEFGFTISMTGYYVFFVVLGLLGWVFRGSTTTVKIDKK